MKLNLVFGFTAVLMSLFSFSAFAVNCANHQYRCMDNERGETYMQERMQNSGMTQEQIAYINQQIATVKAQRQAEAAQNPGNHLTAAEQEQQSGELNYISQEIYEMKHPGQ